jgi:hypothetical protein
MIKLVVVRGFNPDGKIPADTITDPVSGKITAIWLCLYDRVG